VPVALAEVLVLALAEALAAGVVEAAEAEEEEEEDELLQPAAASPMHATPSSAASRVDEVLGISTPTTIATTGCGVQQRQTASSGTLSSRARNSVEAAWLVLGDRERRSSSATTRSGRPRLG
jgi:hypothetical protein